MGVLRFLDRLDYMHGTMVYGDGRRIADRTPPILASGTFQFLTNCFSEIRGLSRPTECEWVNEKCERVNSKCYK